MKAKIRVISFNEWEYGVRIEECGDELIEKKDYYLTSIDPKPEWMPGYGTEARQYLQCLRNLAQDVNAKVKAVERDLAKHKQDLLVTHFSMWVNGGGGAQMELFCSDYLLPRAYREFVSSVPGEETAIRQLIKRDGLLNLTEVLHVRAFRHFAAFINKEYEAHLQIIGLSASDIAAGEIRTEYVSCFTDILYPEVPYE